MLRRDEWARFKTLGLRRKEVEKDAVKEVVEAESFPLLEASLVVDSPHRTDKEADFPNSPPRPNVFIEDRLFKGLFSRSELSRNSLLELLDEPSLVVAPAGTMSLTCRERTEDMIMREIEVWLSNPGRRRSPC